MDYKFPFRIGIVGHKSLTDNEKLYVGKEINKTIVTVQRTIETLRKKHNIKSDFFISGITSLAEGADRVFATEVIKLPGYLEVILPFRKEIYLNDFWGEESKTEFSNLLSYDSYPLITDTSYQPSKDWAYYNTSKLIVEQSDVLIAVWDETPVKTKIGGTANLIEYARGKGIPVIIVFPKPVSDRKFEKENTLAFENISATKYNEFDKEWIPALTQLSATSNTQSAFNENAFKQQIAADDYLKFTPLLGINKLWYNRATTFDKLNNRTPSTKYILVSAIAIVSLFAFCISHLPLQTYFINNLPGALQTGALLLNQSSVFAYWVIAVLSIALGIIAWRKKHLEGLKKLNEAAFWKHKADLHLYKVATLVSGNESIDHNNSLEVFRNNSVDSRMFLISAKEIWNNYSAKLPLSERALFLKNNLLEKTLQLKADELKLNSGLSNKQNLLFWVLLALGITGALAVLALSYIPNISKSRANYTYWYEAIQILVIATTLSGLLAYAWQKMKKHDHHFISNAQVKKQLAETLEVMDELSATEDQLEHIFNQTETLLLQNAKLR